jgi:hypothetical protein
MIGMFKSEERKERKKKYQEHFPPRRKDAKFGIKFLHLCAFAPLREDYPNSL